MTESEKVLEFFSNKPGWIKKNPSDAAERLRALGFVITDDQCKALQKVARRNLKDTPIIERVGRKRLFFDIETSPNIVLSWRIGNKVSLSHENIIAEREIICVSWKWEHDERVFTLTWDPEARCDRKLVEQFVTVLHAADEVVAHNGDSYDVPWIRARAFFWGIPLSQYKKSLYKTRLASNMYLNSRRLDYISKFLGGEGKIHTEYDMWKKILMDKDEQALRDMVTYCEQDVRELESIYHELKSYNTPFTHAGVIKGNGKCSCHECGSTDLKYHRMLTTPKGSITHELICSGCKSFMTITDNVYRQNGFIK
jgi:hypothetical protein